jgi:hypothetical protein
MDAARQIAQLLEAALEVLSRPREHGRRARWLPLQPLAEYGQLERGRHEPLLRTVVEIALDAPPRLIRWRHVRRRVVVGVKGLDHRRFERRVREQRGVRTEKDRVLEADEGGVERIGVRPHPDRAGLGDAGERPQARSIRIAASTLTRTRCRLCSLRGNKLDDRRVCRHIAD